MQTAVRKRAADFDFWGDTPTPEFCENSHERGPRSPAGTAQGFDPPLGHTGTRRARRERFAPESSGRRRTGGGVPRRARRRRFSPGRRGQGAVPDGAAGASGARGAGAFLPGGGGGAGRGRAWPREAHKGRVAGAAARGGHVAGRRGAGGLRGFPGRTRGRRGGRRARGGKAGAAARCRGAAGGGVGKTAAPSAACVGFQATSAIEAAARAKKPVFAL